jgi:exodeoxyribonuclease VII large subunit
MHLPDASVGNVFGVSETFTVGELCTALSTAVATAFPDEVWVKGSISSLTRSANGHVYFDLVDPADDLGSAAPGLLPVALFASDRNRVNAILKKAATIRMSDGVEIRIRGRVAYYPPQGRIQLRMSLIDPAYTVGQMAAARQTLLATLAAEGLLHANRRLELPTPPLRVALVTSEGSAAHADFIHEVALGGYPFEVELYDCRVQGVDAVPSIVEAITRAGAGVASLDVVVLIRGGGARTDLAAFDHERVARAIAACPLPVLVGVGHEIDRSVADEVAHTSAKTPTAAAAVLVDAVRSFHSNVEQAAARLAALATARLDAATGYLAGSGGRLVSATNALLASHDGQLDRQGTQIQFLAQRYLERSAATVNQAELRLRSFDPAVLLARGWSITHTAEGELVRHALDVSPGTTLVTTVSTGRLVSTVVDIDSTPATPPAARAHRPPVRPPDNPSATRIND